MMSDRIESDKKLNEYAGELIMKFKSPGVSTKEKDLAIMQIKRLILNTTTNSNYLTQTFIRYKTNKRKTSIIKIYGE